MYFLVKTNINNNMITRIGIQMMYQHLKNKSSPWQAITDISNEYKIPIIEVFYSLEQSMREEVLRQVDNMTNQSSKI
jgi:hypothetical protein